MSMAATRPGLADDLAPGSALSDRMPGGIALSAVLHVALLTVIVLGLPNFFRPPPPQEAPIAVDLVTIAPETRATHPNPHHPVPHAKPIPPSPGPVAPVPPPKPVPPEASAAPPPSSAAPPPPAPTPPKPEVKPTPPPPPPPKPAEAEAPPPPPPPPKPAPPKPKPAEPNQSPQAFDQLMKQLDKQQQKPQPAAFDSLLKNLSHEDTARSEDTPPRPVREAATAPPSSQPQAPLGSQLSASEIDLIREQISRCWNVPAGARDAKDLVVEIHVLVNPDGTVRQATIVDQGRLASDPDFRAAAESARRAFYNPECTPLRLPPDKYEVWKDLVVDFSPKDVL